MPQTNHTPAVQLARQGFRVFALHGVHDGRCTCPNPTCTGNSRGKHPRASGWQEKASSDPAKVAKAFQPFQNANIGIVTGSGLFVIDVDGAEGEQFLAELESKHGPLPTTRESITSRGRHLFFHCPVDVKIGNKVAIAPHLDVRGDGGYVVGPGSTHASGKRYEWKLEHTPIAHAPAWLLYVLRSKGAPADATANECIPEGERNQKMFDLACALFREGKAEIEVLQRVLAINTERCVPPYPESDIKRIVAQVAESNIPASAQKRKIALRWFELDAQELLTNMDIIRLTDTQLGWRIRFLSFAWLNGGKLPTDVEELAAMARPSSKPKFRKEYRLALFDFLEVSERGESFLINGALADRHSKASAKWDEQRRAGLASAEKRERSKQIQSEREEIAA